MRHSWWGVGFLVVLVGGIFLLDAVLMPFVAGMILAYLADPLADRLEHWGMGRVLAVTSVFFIMALVLVISLLIVVPLIIQQAKQFGESLPVMFEWVKNVLAPKLEEWAGYDLQTEMDNIQQVLTKHWRDAGGYLAQALGQIGRSGMALVSWVTFLALVPVVTFYLLLDWDHLMQRLADLVPRRWLADTLRLAGRCDEVLSAFLRGQGRAVRESLGQLPVEIGRSGVGPHRDRPVVDVVARPHDEAAVAREREVRVAAGADTGLVAVGAQDDLDLALRVSTGGDERGVEVVGRAVGVDADDAVARWGQPVVGRHLERARVGRGDVFVATCHDGLDGVVHAEGRGGGRIALVCELIPRISGVSPAISPDLGSWDRSAYVWFRCR